MKRSVSHLVVATVFVIGISGTAHAIEPNDDSNVNKEAAGYPADNSGRNVRDRDDATVTPGDQSETEADIKLTQSIRKEVVANDTLSVTAQNIKIIAANGVVTLRGPVKTESERQQIAAVAERIAGAGRVQNQLEVAQ